VSHPKNIELQIKILKIYFKYYIMNTSFKRKYSFDDRLRESTRIINMYPDRLPIICERFEKASYDCPFIDKKKYLIPTDLTVGQFIHVIRNRLNFPTEKALFLFIGEIIPYTSQEIGSYYHIYRDPDGFLYIYYTLENTFG